MAKLRPDQLDGALRKQLAPVYLVCGEEPLLIQEACDSIRQAARKAGFSEHERYHGDAGFDWDQLLTSVNSLSLFADRKLIEVRIDSGKTGDKGAKALSTFCDHTNDDTLLLLIIPGKPDQRSKWLKQIDKIGAIIQVWPINGPQLPRWIEQRLGQAGLQADRAAIDLLASKVEGNLLAAVQEIEKLKLLADGPRISIETVAAAVSDSARYDVFGLIDKALAGDSRSAVKTLQGLRGEGSETTVVLWALAREIRTLCQIAQSTQQGQSFDWACKNNGVWDKRKPAVQQALRRLQLAQLQLMLRKANAIDKAIKGMRDADPWDELMDLTLNLSGVTSLSPTVQKLALML